MGYTLKEVAQTLKESTRKVQLLYAFNGTGKTRLSREFKNLISPKVTDTADEQKIKTLYYNAYTEDLFNWDNDLDEDTDRKLMIRPNRFTHFVLQFLRDQELDNNIATNFQHYATSSITPIFNNNFSEVSFTYATGSDNTANNIKISKGEESNFIWCVFYSLIEQVVGILKEPEKDERSTNQFDDLEYIFIDDPISSLDENHLIELAVNLAQLIKRSNDIKFIISTHNPLFYNVLYNELNLKRKKDSCYLLSKNLDGTFKFVNKFGDSNKSFSYHMYIKKIIEEGIATDSIEKYHFILLRNLYEKTANFLGYPKWSELLPGDKKVYYNRIIQFTSHSTLSNEVVSEPTDPEKRIVEFLLNHLTTNFNYWQENANEAV